jgi:hypothetical protein
MVNRKSGGKRGEKMMGKEMLHMMVSSGLRETFQKNVHLSHLLYIIRAAS